MAKIFFLENFTHNSGLVNFLFCVCKVIYIFSFSQTFNKLFLPSHYHIYTSKMPKFIISNRLPKERYLNNFSPPPKRPFHHHPEDLSITPRRPFHHPQEAFPSFPYRLAPPPHIIPTAPCARVHLLYIPSLSSASRFTREPRHRAPAPIRAPIPNQRSSFPYRAPRGLPASPAPPFTGNTKKRPCSLLAGSSFSLFIRGL